MIRFYPNERFREIPVDYKLRYRYAVSERGRLISFTEKFEDGNLLKGGNSRGYTTFRYAMFVGGKRTSRVLFIHKFVAEFFLPKTSDEQQHVLHIDHVLSNNNVANLKWATYQEMQEHRRTNPKVIKAKKNLIEHNLKADGKKLTVTKVIHLKKLLEDPNRKTRLKMLAKQFGISEMQVCRIKSGENWSQVKI